MFDTIVAIATGSINQPISIIRISGPNSFFIMKKIYKGQNIQHQKITHGFIFENKTIIDEVLVSWFKSPNSFTGENIVEINLHGGVINTQKILKLVLSHGARMAEKGEFSRRAFLNGKMDLVKAEAIHDLIFSKTEEQAQLSVKKFDGETSKFIHKLEKKILNIIATIETNIDYPEYDDIENLNNEIIKPKLNEIIKDLENIHNISKKAQYIFKGVNVAIVGKPNAGKSSLLNALLNEEKAIVTNIPGTTRDIVEGSLQLDQVLLNFKDTAGIRQSSNDIEKIGIKKSIETLKNSDLIIHVIDSTQKDFLDEKNLLKNIDTNKYIKVFNKSDLFKKNVGISISAKNKDISNLLNEIRKRFSKINLNNEKIITNSRQLSLVKKTSILIKDALKNINKGFEPDEVILEIRNAWKSLASILGKSSDEKLLDEMFKNFCLGK